MDAGFGRDGAGFSLDAGIHPAASSAPPPPLKLTQGAADALGLQDRLLRPGHGKTFMDPVHGQFKLPPEAVALLDTQPCQRLRELKQLGVNYWVCESRGGWYRVLLPALALSIYLYLCMSLSLILTFHSHSQPPIPRSSSPPSVPGASHNRFEHSLGTAHLAWSAAARLGALQGVALGLAREDVPVATLAGLVHDLGHGPFSHVFDNELLPRLGVAGWSHEEMSGRLLDLALDEAVPRSNDLEALDPSEFRLVAALVAGSKARVGGGGVVMSTTAVGGRDQPAAELGPASAGAAAPSSLGDPDASQAGPSSAPEAAAARAREAIDRRCPAAEAARRQAPPGRRYLFDLVNNETCSVDVDKFDYLLRDAHYTGVRVAFEVRPVAASMQVHDDRVAFKDSQVHKRVCPSHRPHHCRNNHHLDHNRLILIALIIIVLLIVIDQPLPPVSTSSSTPGPPYTAVSTPTPAPRRWSTWWWTPWPRRATGSASATPVLTLKPSFAWTTLV